MGLSCSAGTPIYLGESNIKHMKSSHPEDFDAYGDDIPLIISSPDFIALNNKDNSIEYVKSYVTQYNEHVKLAVRVSNNGSFFARSLYALNNQRVSDYIEKGTLVPY